jgi:anti-sigma factor RsiW
MSHDPEPRAAAYLGAAMRRTARQRYEAHLLSCERCWLEVTLGRRGRALAETACEPAPAGIREDIRAAVAARAATPQPRWLLLRRGTVAAIVCAGLLAACFIALRPWQASPAASSAAASPQAALAAAVASYRHDQLPGTAVPARAAPDLARLGFRLAGAASGQVNHVAVTMFVYRDAAGGHLILYRSARPFTEAAEARELHGPEGAWMAQAAGVSILCGRGAHSLLILGPDPAIVRRVGATLGVL